MKSLLNQLAYFDKINYQFIINDNLNLNDAIYQIQKLEKEKEN